MARRAVTATATSSFGVSRRESHDSRGFYARFTAPALSSDDEVAVASAHQVDRIWCKDARTMADDIPDASVALVVTSPPYFAGKEYEEALGEGDIPATYLEYLELLEEVFAVCKRKLEPGGRIAVNVANLGRKPYRSLSADVVTILQDHLELLLRGEIVWVKGKSPGSSCAWGSFQSAANPVLRDTTERILVASKGRFDRALSRRRRHARGLPSEVTIGRDEFIESTTDVWHMQPESAHRVGHPAPFPVELPERLIHLFTYRDDLVLDPFIGSGSTAVAAVRADRRFLGYETDPRYKTIADTRVEEGRRRARTPAEEARRVVLPAVATPGDGAVSSRARALRRGLQAKEVARLLLADVGFVDVVAGLSLPCGVDVTLAAHDRRGRRWLFDLSGSLSYARTGLRSLDTTWKALGKAVVLRCAGEDARRLVLLTTELPERGSAAEAALSAARGDVFREAIDILDPDGHALLGALAAGARGARSSSR